MKMATTYVWGVAADDAGIIQHTSYGSKSLPGGGLRAWKDVEVDHEPATSVSRQKCLALLGVVVHTG